MPVNANLFTLLNPTIRTPIAISLGAIPGALCRYYLTVFLTRWLGNSFPFGTFLINISGSLLMGFFVTLTLKWAIASTDLRLLVVVGFLGSYTTFSTYALDISSLLNSGNYSLGLFYGLGSAFLGLISLQFGSWLASML
jgi:fluoride exporter